MDIQQLLRRATPLPQSPVTGHWATLAFRPDLGSQQEFIVGVAAAVDDGGAALHVKWLPSLSRLSSLYGDALATSDTRHLFDGSELAIRASFHTALSGLDSGTPHVRVIPCGYLACDDIELELARLLKRQAGAIWHDAPFRESPKDDDWAYATMQAALGSLRGRRNPFVLGRAIEVAGKRLEVGLNNDTSYGNIVSARYAAFATIQNHIQSSSLQLISAHRHTHRLAAPALFVVLPEARGAAEVALAKNTTTLLDRVGDSGLEHFASADPAEVAAHLIDWSATT